jgi:hypothetical protein
MGSRAVHGPEFAFAAYGLALHITGDSESALASVELAAERPAPTEAEFFRTVRREARAQRAAAPDPATLPRPSALSCVSLPDWEVLERVAYRGMTVTEAAAAVGIDRGEALRRLQRGLVAAGDCLAREREPGDDPQPAGLDLLGVDPAAHALDDPARDRQPEAAAVDVRRL